MAIRGDAKRIPVNKNILVDTNIWLFIFGVQTSWQDPGYSDILDKLKNNNVNLFVNSSIISEYINTTIRTAYSQFLLNNNKSRNDFLFKRDYQKTDDFKLNYNVSMMSVKEEILKNSQLSPADNSSVTQSITGQGMKKLKDFNDRLIINDAVSNRLDILTDDRDYFKYEGNIIIYTI